ncbi:Guanine nucleotide-binding protein alpha-2 subunit [Elasticomyces elasticus]|nr:Guanine nucleotide-binding protein alpha-2 subunit [Elasticomyces elasticus]
MEKDTASLVVHYDDRSSFRSKFSDAGSKLSATFAFDRELWVTDVYARRFRHVLKREIREPRDTSNGPDETRTEAVPFAYNKAEWAESQTIDRALEKDSKRLRRECQVLIMGTCDADKDALLKLFKITNGGGYSLEELRSYRGTVRATLIDNARRLLRAMVAVNLDLEDPCRRELVQVIQQSSMGVDLQESMEPNIGAAVVSLWNHPDVARVTETRITAADYTPTEADILRVPIDTVPGCGLREMTVSAGRLSVRLVYVPEQQGRPKKWINSFEGITAIIFLVDLAEYDEVASEDVGHNKIMENLVLFDSIVNSRLFTRSSIILLFTNANCFKRKLAMTSLNTYFPDYPGGEDPSRAAKYLLWRFNQLNRANLNLYPHIVELSDEAIVGSVFAALKEIILQNALREAEISPFSTKGTPKPEPVAASH